MIYLQYKKQNIMRFTHYWIADFGWENTIFQPIDFKEVEILGKNKEGIVYLGIAENNQKHILLNSNK